MDFGACRVGIAFWQVVVESDVLVVVKVPEKIQIQHRVPDG